MRFFKNIEYALKVVFQPFLLKDVTVQIIKIAGRAIRIKIFRVKGVKIVNDQKSRLEFSGAFQELAKAEAYN